MTGSGRLGLALFLALGAGCGGNSRQVENMLDKPIWEDRDASPYSFYRSVAYTLLRTRQYVRASRTIRRLIETKPDLPEPYYLMARAYVGMKEYASAEKMLNRALQRSDGYAPAYSYLGVLHNLTGQHKKAARAHARAIKLDGTNPSYRNNLGFGYYLQGRYREAIAAYRAALELDMGSARAHNNLGFAYAGIGDMEAAYRHFLLAGPPAQASNNMGYVHEQKGEFERAYDYYLIAVRQDRQLIPARNNLEAVCERLGRPLPDVGIDWSRKPGAPPPEPREALDPPSPPDESPEEPASEGPAARAEGGTGNDG